MDIYMPIMDGFEATKLIMDGKKTKSKNLKINVVITSAYSNREEIDYGLSLGAIYFISKPIQISELKYVLNTYL